MLFRFSMFFVSVLATCFSRSLPISLKCWNYWHNVFVSSLQYLWYVMLSILSFITDIGNLYLFFLIIFARGLLVLFIFSKNKFCLCESLLFVFCFLDFCLYYFLSSTTLEFNAIIFFFYLTKVETYVVDFKPFFLLIWE